MILEALIKGKLNLKSTLMVICIQNVNSWIVNFQQFSKVNPLIQIRFRFDGKIYFCLVFTIIPHSIEIFDLWFELEIASWLLIFIALANILSLNFALMTASISSYQIIVIALMLKMSTIAAFLHTLIFW